MINKKKSFAFFPRCFIKGLYFNGVLSRFLLAGAGLMFSLDPNIKSHKSRPN